MHSLARKACAILAPLPLLPLLFPPGLLGYRDGPPVGAAGGFGAMSCHMCHNDSPENSGPGKLDVLGIPELFIASSRYPVTIRMEQPGLTAGGFQIAARFAGGPRMGAQAGTWDADEERTRVAMGGPEGRVQFAEQTEAGAKAVGEGANAWELTWTAPTEPDSGPVVFHVAANGSNDDASALGDFIYTAELHSTPAGR